MFCWCLRVYVRMVVDLSIHACPSSRADEEWNKKLEEVKAAELEQARKHVQQTVVTGDFFTKYSDSFMGKPELKFFKVTQELDTSVTTHSTCTYTHSRAVMPTHVTAWNVATCDASHLCTRSPASAVDCGGAKMVDQSTSTSDVPRILL